MKYLIFLLIFLVCEISHASIQLSWEKNHPERSAWSVALISDIDLNFKTFDAARDGSKFCPKYSKLTREQKVEMWAEAIVWDAFYESSWNPKSSGVDVGHKADKNTWSVGLFQLSVTDQANYRLHTGYSFSDLQDPVKNISLAVYIMSNLVSRYGVVAEKPGAGSYWSTLRPNTRAPAIQGHTKALPFCL